MKFDLDELNPGTWFRMPGSDAEICLRVLSGDDFKRIRSEVTKKKAEFRDGRRYTWEEVDEEQMHALTMDQCIVDWRNIVDVNNNPIACTTENKLLLSGKSAAFGKFINECTAKLLQEMESQASELEKNS